MSGLRPAQRPAPVCAGESGSRSSVISEQMRVWTPPTVCASACRLPATVNTSRLLGVDPWCRFSGEATRFGVSPWSCPGMLKCSVPPSRPVHQHQHSLVREMHGPPATCATRMAKLVVLERNLGGAALKSTEHPCPWEISRKVAEPPAGASPDSPARCRERPVEVWYSGPRRA